MTAQHDEGRKAFAEGRPRHENPYDVNTEHWCSWMDGFDQAAVEAEIRPNKTPA